MSWRGWLAGGLGLYILFVVVTLPAAQLLSRIDVPDLRLQGVSGYWWHGRIAQLEVAGRSLGPVTWSWRPSQLLLARLGLEVKLPDAGTNGASATGQADIAVGLAGTWRIDDLSVHLPVARVLQAFPQLPVAATGILDVKIDHAVVSPAGVPEALAGQLVWRDAELQTPVEAQLDSLTADLGLEEGAVLAQLSDDGGDLALDGQARYEPATHLYRLDLALRARRNPPLRDTLSLLGKPDVRGYHTLKRAGRLPH